MAKKVGIAQSMLPKYENGTQIPSYNTAKKIFQILFEEISVHGKKVKDIMSQNFVSVKYSDNLGEILNLMNEKSILQVPVLNNGKPIGHIKASQYLKFFKDSHKLNELYQKTAEHLMFDILPCVGKNTLVQDIMPLLRSFQSVLVVSNGNIIGIVTIKSFIENSYGLPIIPP